MSVDARPRNTDLEPHRMLAMINTPLDNTLIQSAD
jgi:hypothetical protein